MDLSTREVKTCHLFVCLVDSCAVKSKWIYSGLSSLLLKCGALTNMGKKCWNFSHQIPCYWQKWATELLVNCKVAEKLAEIDWLFTWLSSSYCQLLVITYIDFLHDDLPLTWPSRSSKVHTFLLYQYIRLSIGYPLLFLSFLPSPFCILLHSGTLSTAIDHDKKTVRNFFKRKRGI